MGIPLNEVTLATMSHDCYAYNVTVSAKTVLNDTFSITRNTNLKY